MSIPQIKQKVVAYVRVSTGKQEASGLGIEAQLEYIHTAAKAQHWEVVAVFQETVSGTKAPEQRPEMAKAIAMALSMNIPIVAAKIDRISRDVEHMASLMKRVQLKVATMPQADNFQLHLFAALAEQERAFISQRTKDALKALQERADNGCVESIAKVQRRAHNLVGARQAKADMSKAIIPDGSAPKKISPHVAALMPHVKGFLFDGVKTLQGLADALNNAGHFTSRGGSWHPTSVARLMDSLSVSFMK
ncbi:MULTISPECIES: recombinase family protein [unclassified Pseudomonas]|uniref:recombinase family protein n=1 Tax=unclassified Pseudomonas TaxID=196821 RepID=UPI0039B78BF7